MPKVIVIVVGLVLVAAVMVVIRTVGRAATAVIAVQPRTLEPMRTTRSVESRRAEV